jgi:hypothetical protein
MIREFPFFKIEGICTGHAQFESDNFFYITQLHSPVFRHKRSFCLNLNYLGEGAR